ncbi:MAG: elongation factor P maturation arginine rhamnosyltransferase EarP [Methylophilaceae bacterium]|nr:elongation factor P maturation arginine rhamnosyltransferase EarP [Methylotenera sp.]
MNQKWDIFCKVIDNFGDIGVCWRLSKQLSNEYELQVRLWVDDLAIAKKIIPEINTSRASQLIENVEICQWQEDFSSSVTFNIEVADVVIEAFACELPPSYISAMTEKKPVWINLEYLSAESWIDEFHAKNSRHQATGLDKHFFFPGFTKQTGGLLREKNLIAERDAFQGSSTQQQAFWNTIGADKNDSLAISLFCYPHAPIASLLECLKSSSRPVLCLIPKSTIILEISRLLALKSIKVGEKITYGNLTIQIIPFLSQQQYDQLLWACDINFVRGEDSWVRAIWAAKPLIWQPYFQQEDTHIVKRNAFLDSYYGPPDTEAKAAARACHLDWCGQHFDLQHWEALLQNMNELQAYHARQSMRLAQQPDLAAKLVNFCGNRL